MADTSRPELWQKTKQSFWFGMRGMLWGVLHTSSSYLSSHWLCDQVHIHSCMATQLLVITQPRKPRSFGFKRVFHIIQIIDDFVRVSWVDFIDSLPLSTYVNIRIYTCTYLHLTLYTDTYNWYACDRMLQIVYNLAEFLKHRSSFGLYLSVFEKSAASSRRVGTPIHQGSLGFPGMVGFGGSSRVFWRWVTELLCIILELEVIFPTC